MTMPISPRRSALYLPASNPRAIEKARGLPSDVVILDLEDAVAPAAKAAARDAAVAAMREGFGARERVIRANALDTEYAADDLAALRDADVDAVLLPKVSSADDLRRARAILGDGPRLWAMIETCRAIADLAAITGAAAETGTGVAGRRNQRPRQGNALPTRRGPCTVVTRPVATGGGGAGGGFGGARRGQQRHRRSRRN